MADDREDTELPQPGLDEEPSSEHEGAHPTDGPGEVSVDEPTAPALAPEDDDPDTGSRDPSQEGDDPSPQDR